MNVRICLGFVLTIRAAAGFPLETIRVTTTKPSTSPCVRLWGTHDQNTSHDEELLLPPRTVLNPMSQRMIQVRGPTYRNFMKEGKWVQHEGTLKRLDLQALSDYQHGRVLQSRGGISYYDAPPKRERSSQENHYNDNHNHNNVEQWHVITPTVLEEETVPLPLDEDDEDDADIRKQLLFVNKPSGLNCVPSRDLLSDSLSSQVNQLYSNAKPCHRLDRDTSGVVVFGLTAEAHRTVSKQFEARATSKTYVALVAGHLPADKGTCRYPIGKKLTNEGYHRWVIGGNKPRDAVTTWRVDTAWLDADTGAKLSRVELTPLTGRGHQLRLHMKAMGCPILGDTLHAAANDDDNDNHNAVAFCAPRLCLHAHELRIDWNGRRWNAKSVSPF